MILDHKGMVQFAAYLLVVIMFIVQAGNPYKRGRISMVDLLVLTSLDWLLLKVETLFTILQNKLS